MMFTLFLVVLVSTMVCSTDVMVPSVANYELPLVLYKVNSQVNQRCNYITDLRLLVEDLNDVEDKVQRVRIARSPAAESRRRVEQLANTLEELTTVTLQSVQTEISSIRYNKLPEIKGGVERRLKVVEEEAERLKKKLQRLQEEKKNLDVKQNQLREKIARLEGKIETNTQRPNVLPSNSNLQNFQLLGGLDGLSGSGNGVTAFIWPVQNYSVKKRTNEPIYSKPFYHKKGNYSYQLRLYVYFGGDNADGWVSVYLQVMAGPDDNSLPWPITGNYYFSVLSKNPQVPDLKLTAVFDKETINWHRPLSKIIFPSFSPNNQPYGYREAFRHSDIENTNFIVDDTISIGAGISQL